MSGIDFEQVERIAEALERIGDELEYQNAVLSELARAQHLTAVSTNEYSPRDERPESSPNTRSLLTMIRDQEHERENDDRLIADGGDADGDDPRWWGKPVDSRRYHIFEGEAGATSLCGNWMFNRRNEDEISDDAEYREGEDCKACCRKAGVLDDD